jgi:hypothetical protein
MSKKKSKINKYTSDSYRFEPPAAMEVSEDNIQKYIKEVKHMLFHEGETRAFTGTGRCMVIGIKSGKEYCIFVVRNGYEEIVFTKNE